VVSAIARCWANTKRLSAIVGLLTRGGMALGPLLLLLVALPIGTYQIGYREVNWSEYWSSGTGPVVCLAGGLVTAGSWGLAARRSFGRWVS
jgi:hypothetical protein